MRTLVLALALVSFLAAAQAPAKNEQTPLGGGVCIVNR